VVMGRRRRELSPDGRRRRGSPDLTVVPIGRSSLVGHARPTIPSPPPPLRLEPPDGCAFRVRGPFRAGLAAPAPRRAAATPCIALLSSAGARRARAWCCGARWAGRGGWGGARGR